MLFRLIANVILFASLLFLPWWITIVIALIAVFVYNVFYELILWGVVGDLLYGAGVASFYALTSFLSTGALVLFLTAQYLKEKIRFYN